MKKTNKDRPKRIFGLTIGEFIGLTTLVIGVSASIVTAVRYVDRQFSTLNNKVDLIDDRTKRIEVDLKKTSDLLDVYLTWRFLYVNDPTRKNLTPQYDPSTRTLEFVIKDNGPGK